MTLSSPLGLGLAGGDGFLLSPCGRLSGLRLFLGLGLPWTMASVYHIANGTEFYYPAGSLVFSVLVFFAFAVVCIALLVFRRFYYDGELGGNKMFAYACSAFLGFSWFTYILVSSLQTVGHIG